MLSPSTALMAIGESHKGTMSKGQKREFVSGLRTMNERDAALQYVLGQLQTHVHSYGMSRRNTSQQSLLQELGKRADELKPVF